MNNLDFFDTMQIYTCKKVSADVLPCSIDVVREYYPHKPDFSRFAHYKIPVDKLDTHFLNLMDTAGMTPKHAEVFYRPGNGLMMDAFIHTDGHRVIPGFAKINYILGGSGNIMNWWRPKSVSEKNNMLTPIGTKYLRFTKDECTLLDSVEMLGLYVINAGIPHSVEMSSGSVEQPRICISVTPLLKETMNNVECNDAYARLESAISLAANSPSLSL